MTRPSTEQADRTVLRALSRQAPTIDAATAEIARAAAELELPSPTIHVVSDVHSEYKKLRHIINNASGTLRPLVEQLLGDHLSAAEMQEFLSLIFYPGEMLEHLAPQLNDPEQLRSFARRSLGNLFEIVRCLGSRRSLRRVEQLFPAEYRDLLAELLFAPSSHRHPE
jgi:fructose-1,6-bisphosphatase-3